MAEKIRFTKMQGTGKDYICINAFEQRVDDAAALARRMCDRHFGVGGDGLALILPSALADIRMQLFNPDGSGAAMCGNAARCVALLAHERALVGKDVITLETDSGIKVARLHNDGGQTCCVSIDMGVPVLTPAQIPVICEPSLTASEEASRLVAQPFEVAGRIWAVTAVAVGIPHAVIFVDDVAGQDLAQLGPLLERHPSFPQRTNVDIVQTLASDKLRMRIWERGVGETLSCGTGACAAAVASVLNGYGGRELTVESAGGSLHVHWDTSDDHLFLTGNAETVFEGVFFA